MEARHIINYGVQFLPVHQVTSERRLQAKARLGSMPHFPTGRPHTQSAGMKVEVKGVSLTQSRTDPTTAVSTVVECAPSTLVGKSACGDCVAEPTSDAHSVESTPHYDEDATWVISKLLNRKALSACNTGHKQRKHTHTHEHT